MGEPDEYSKYTWISKSEEDSIRKKIWTNQYNEETLEFMREFNHTQEKDKLLEEYSYKILQGSNQEE